MQGPRALLTTTGLMGHLANQFNRNIDLAEYVTSQLLCKSEDMYPPTFVRHVRLTQHYSRPNMRNSMYLCYSPLPNIRLTALYNFPHIPRWGDVGSSDTCKWINGFINMRCTAMRLCYFSNPYQLYWWWKVTSTKPSNWLSGALELWGRYWFDKR